jgi:hypothetical protein
MRTLTRRKLLNAAAGGAGAALLAPFYREALAAPQTPARLVIVLECNCYYPVTVLTSSARNALGAAAIGTEIMFSETYPSTVQTLTSETLSSALCLDPLAASSGNISLDNRGAALFGLSSKVAGGGHSSGTGALSCAIDGAAATIDAVLAPRLKGTAPFDAIRLGTSSSPTPIVYQTCNFGPHKPAPVLVDPKLAYQTVFGSVAAGQSTGAERTALFNFAHDDVHRALATFRGNSNERAKLERYLGALETLSARESQLGTMATNVRPLLPPSPDTNPLLMGVGQTPDAMKWLEAMFQIATTSLLGGLTNTVVLASGSSGFDIHYDPAITTSGRHDLQHGINTPANWTAITTITRKHVSLIAQLARTLAATPELGASGSMLDHTMIVFMSDNGEQHHSTSSEWPIVVLGGNALGLKTDGRTVIYPALGAANNRQVSNFMNTLGHAAGDSTFDMFGNEGATRIAPGPLSELI